MAADWVQADRVSQRCRWLPVWPVCTGDNQTQKDEQQALTHTPAECFQSWVCETEGWLTALFPVTGVANPLLPFFTWHQQSERTASGRHIKPATARQKHIHKGCYSGSKCFATAPRLSGDFNVHFVKSERKCLAFSCSLPFLPKAEERSAITLLEHLEEEERWLMLRPHQQRLFLLLKWGNQTERCRTWRAYIVHTVQFSYSCKQKTAFRCGPVLKG